MPIIDLACQWCGKVLETPGRARQHEPVCGANPHRGSHGGTHKRQAIEAGKNDRCQYCHREVSRSGKHKHEAACARRRSA